MRTAFTQTILAAMIGLSTPALASLAYVSNEKDNTLSIIDTETLEVVDTIDVGQRPRGILLSKDASKLYICASDDDTVQVLDLATRKITDTLPSGEDPEQFSLHPNDKHLYIANEDDAIVTVVDVETKDVLAQIDVGIEPEGMAVSPNGKWAVNTSETSSMLHWINTETFEIEKNIVIGQRPRHVEFSKDSKIAWASAEIGGTVHIIDVDKLEQTHELSFKVPGVSPDRVQPVGIELTSNGEYAFVALGPSNHVAVVDANTYEILDYLLVGSRVWQLDLDKDEKRLYTTNGVSGDVSVIDVDALKVIKSIKVGRYPWGVVVDPEFMTVEAINLSFRYGDKTVLDEVSFTLTSGRFHALLGPNGAGKSTLFGLLTRLLALHQGDVRLAGQSLQKQPADAMRQIGVVFQQNALDLDLTVSQNLHYHAALHGLSRKEARVQAELELERVGLQDRANDTVRTLNGGHRRRVEIARALLHQPSLLLLDEPTVGLDVASRKAINNHVRTLCEQDGLTVLWATHLIEEVREDDQVLILHQGRLLANGPGHTICKAEGASNLSDTFHALTGAG